MSRRVFLVVVPIDSSRFVLILSLIAALLLFSWQIVGLVAIGQDAFIDESAIRPKSVGKLESGIGLEQVAALHLFGDASANQIIALRPPIDTPRTDLKLVLIGAITDTDPKKASALIGAGNQSRRYFVGDNIDGGAVLHEVRPDSVVLQHEDRNETLFFSRSGDNLVLTTTSHGSKKPLGKSEMGGVINAASPENYGETENASLRDHLQLIGENQSFFEDE